MDTTGAFNLYDNTYLSSNGANPVSVIGFTSLIDFNVEYNSTVSQEVLERGSYSVDSKQNKATIIKLTASYTPLKNIISLREQVLEVQKVVKLLQAYKEGTQLVTISMENPPMFDIYANLTLFNFKYQLNAYETGFYADLSFLQVRQTVGSSGALPQDQVSQDNYASKNDQGEQVPNPSNGLGT